MFCPSCGLTEDRQVQYCRSCGTDLRAVRTSLAAPEPAPNTVSGARSEIGRALAARMREIDDLSELEDALPAIEKFMESANDRRLRRMRAGMVTAAVGLGATVFFLLFAMMQPDLLFAPGLGVVAFLIGVGMILNGKFLTLPAGTQPAALPSQPDESMKSFLNRPNGAPALPMGAPVAQPSSVTENTTRHLGGSPGPEENV